VLPVRGIPHATDAALVRFANCADVLRNLRAAAIRSRSTAGYALSGGAAAGAPAVGSAVAAPRAAGQAGVSGPYSGTNDAVVGVDEPDIIKTDGRRIVTVIGGVLRVVDARTRQLTGVLNLSSTPGFYGAEPVNLLLSGDHALILVQQGYSVVGPVPYGASGTGTPGAGPQTGGAVHRDAPMSVPILGPRLLLVDLSGAAPRIISQYTIDGSLVDARLVGSVARVVIQSQPRVVLPMEPAHTPRAAGGVASWLPRYSVTGQATRQIGRVSCASVSHPVNANYTGTSMLTVLTFDLSAGSLGSGWPVTILGDGGIVYSSGSSLYIANGEQWFQPPSAPVQGGAAQMALPAQYTAVYKFGISGSGPPVFEAAGTVPGFLLGVPGMAQYSLSDFGGVLRVATTSSARFGWWVRSQRSAVYDLEQVGNRLLVVGKVGGLGAGEQIYAVRFEGPVAYVVTYRQVDPLYTLDLADPAQPRVVGELMLRGYSAYLDQIEPARLIGVGQGTTSFGETTGTQISLFDTSDLAAPVRLAVYHVRFAHSEAEFDPHAFLYWPPTRTLVLPVQLPFPVSPVPQPAPPASGQPQPVPQPAWPASGAIIMRVGDHSLTRIGMITQPAVPGWPGGGQIQRSLVIGDTLWTLSQAGLKANDLSTLAPVAWVPFGWRAVSPPLPGSPSA